MPRYDFECQNTECGLRFDLVLKMGEHLFHECPACHEQAPRVLAGQVFAFDFKPGTMTKETNTGVHRDDYPTADRAVGKDAEVRWKYYEDRAQVKKAVRAGGGTYKLGRADVGVPGEGFTEYEALTPEKAQERRAKATAAMAALRADQAIRKRKQG